MLNFPLKLPNDINLALLWEWVGLATGTWEFLRDPNKLSVYPVSNLGTSEAQLEDLV